MLTAASSTAELAALRAAIAGTVTMPDDPAYEARRAPTVPQSDDVRPLAIVSCRSAEDVAHVLTVAARLAMPVVPRSGGHCFAGRSTTTGIVIDVSPLDRVTVDGAVAIVGAGVRLGKLYDALDQPGRAVPAGCGATVGITGLTLGGGIGVLGRAYGLTCDRLVAAEVVLADGSIAHCAADHHADLFWALRGSGGGQFGIVTSLSLHTVPAPTTTTFHLQWDEIHAAATIAAWQRWAPTAPDTVDATLEIAASTDPAEPLRVHLVGAVHDTVGEALNHLDDLVMGVGADPATVVTHYARYRDAKRWLSGRRDEHTPDPTIPVVKSGLFRRNLPPELVTSLLEHLTTRRAVGQRRHLTFTPLGGGYHRVPVHATAFAHRRERFMLEHGTSAPRADLATARAWARRSWAIARAAGGGRVYPNFPDTELTDPARAYHGENLTRLRQVKTRYDPNRTFRFHQSL